jgi:hypothetical protein
MLQRKNYEKYFAVRKQLKPHFDGLLPEGRRGRQFAAEHEPGTVRAPSLIGTESSCML